LRHVMLRLCLSTLSLLLLEGCAGAQLIGWHSAQPTIPPLAVFERSPAHAVDLGEVSATTCLNNFFDSRPSWKIALDNIKVVAAQRGANSVSGVTYADRNLFLCPTGLKFTARAIVAMPASLEELTRQAPSRKCELETGSLSDFMACKIVAVRSNLP
jgi:hypothetical protein